MIKISFNMLVVLLVIISIIVSTLAWIALSSGGTVIPVSQSDNLGQGGGGNIGGQVGLTILPANQSFLLNKSLNEIK